MDIIIVGCGRVGFTLVEQLINENHSIVVVDEDETKIQYFTEELDVMGIVGNGVDYQTLLEAGIEHASLLIAATDVDEQNLLCCVMAKRLEFCKTIACVRNPIYNTEISFLRKELGLSMILNPELIAANEIARTFQFPSAIQIDTFTRGRIELLHFQDTGDSLHTNNPLKYIHTRLKCNVLVCIVTREDDVFIPSIDFVFRKDDRITIVANPVDADAFFLKIGLHTNRAQTAMIVGGGTVGYYLAKRLSDVGIQTKIIENDPQRCDELSELLPNVNIINGDGADEHLLAQEGLRLVDAFAALTGIDEENVLLSLYAKGVSRGRIVTKINRTYYSGVISNMQLDSVIFPSFLAADYITKYVRSMNQTPDSNMENLFKLENGRAEALEFFITEPSVVTDTPIRQLRLKSDLIICSITRNGQVIIPSGHDELRVGDAVIIITTRSRFYDIKDIIKR